MTWALKDRSYPDGEGRIKRESPSEAKRTERAGIESAGLQFFIRGYTLEIEAEVAHLLSSSGATLHHRAQCASHQPLPTRPRSTGSSPLPPSLEGESCLRHEQSFTLM